jgi:hypothetical protein
VVAGPGSSAAAVLYGATLMVGSVYFNGIWRWAEQPLIAEMQQVLGLMADGRSMSFWLARTTG